MSNIDFLTADVTRTFRGSEVVMEQGSIREFESGPKRSGKNQSISRKQTKVKELFLNFQFQIKYLTILITSLAPINARILTKLH